MNRNYNKKFDMKNEKGAISLFVVLAMLFFLVFMVGSYTMISRRNQQQAESMAQLKNAYNKDGETQYDLLMGSSEVRIPITSKENYYKMITGESIVHEGITYQATEDAKYQIQSVIEIPISEIVGFKGDDTATFKFKDYLIYSDSYDVECSGGAGVFYEFNGERYKLLVYEGMGTVSDTDYKTNSTSSKFSMYNDAALYSSEPYEFLVYICENGDTSFKALNENSTYFTTSVTGTLPKLSELECIKNNVESGDKFFVFIKYKELSTVVGKKLSNVVNVGDYVKYKLDYSSLMSTDEDTQKTIESEWRVVSKEYDSSTGSYKVKLICAGSPIQEQFASDVSSFNKKLFDNFETTTFNTVAGGTVSGRYFRNAYAESVCSMDYSTLSLAITEDINSDYIDIVGQNNTSVADGYSTYVANGGIYKENKDGLLNNGTKYWIGFIDSISSTYPCYIASDQSNAPLAMAGINATHYIRPVVTLVDNLVVVETNGVVGDGSKEYPYDIKLTDTTTTGAAVGEYVLYANKLGDYSDSFNYRNIDINGKKSTLEGWRILDIDGDTVKLISAGIPLRYNYSDKSIDTIISELGDNFESTTFERIEASSTNTGNVVEVKGSEFLNSLYAEDISVFNYEELSYAVYDNPDYLTVSMNEGFGVSKNTLADDAYEYVINNWNSKKTDLINVGANYILSSKINNGKVIVHNSEYLTQNDTTTYAGIRVVVTLKTTSKFIGGTGTSENPYRLSTDATADVGEFKIGDYVKYDGMYAYTNISKTDDGKDASGVTQTGWRVLSYENGKLRLVSAGLPYYAQTFVNNNNNNGNGNAITAMNYAQYIKNMEYNNLSFYDSTRNRLSDNYNPISKSAHVSAMEGMDYEDYTSLVALYEKNEVSKDMIYLNRSYWLGSYIIESSWNSAGYKLRYVSFRGRDESVAQKTTYGVRVVITITDAFTVEAGHSGSADDPHVLTFN